MMAPAGRLGLLDAAKSSTGFSWAIRKERNSLRIAFRVGHPIVSRKQKPPAPFHSGKGLTALWDQKVPRGFDGLRKTGKTPKPHDLLHGSPGVATHKTPSPFSCRSCWRCCGQKILQIFRGIREKEDRRIIIAFHSAHPVMPANKNPKPLTILGRNLRQ